MRIAREGQRQDPVVLGSPRRARAARRRLERRGLVATGREAIAAWVIPGERRGILAAGMDAIATPRAIGRSHPPRFVPVGMCGAPGGPGAAVARRLAPCHEAVYAMHGPGNMRAVLIALGLSAPLLGCVDGELPRPQLDETCFVGGCSHEVCSDRPFVFTPCVWYAVYACYQGATCARQPGGACGWTATPELDACVASYPPPRS